MTFTKGHKTNIGRPCAEKTREKLRKINLGKKKSEETKKKISASRKGIPAWNKGTPMTEESRKKMSISHAGKPLTKEHRANISKGGIGKKMSVDARRQISESRKGMRFTEEHRKNLSISHLGHIPSNKGVPCSEEKKIKIRKSIKGKIHHDDAWKEYMSNRMKGINHPLCDKDYLLKHGHLKSYEPYCELFNKDLKERCRTWYGYACVECGTPQGANLDKNGRLLKLIVHHAHYDKQTCCNGSPEDMVVLCPSCHVRTNYNRDYWEQHFTDLIYNYYGGKSFLTKEEMKTLTGKNRWW